MGDFNHPSITWDPAPVLPDQAAPDSSSARFVECVRDTYLHQHITEPTRFRHGQTPARDDLLFTNEEDMVGQLQLMDPIGASDHTSVAIRLAFTREEEPPTRAAFNYNKADYAAMGRMLEKDWRQLLEGKSAQEMADTIQAEIMEAVRRHTPTKNSRPNRIPKPSYMNSTALRKVKKKHSTWIRYLNTKAGQDHEDYIRARNEAAHACRKARRDFESRLAREIKNNNKAFWTYVNSRRKVKPGMPDLTKADGTIARENKEKAEVLNNQYAETFTTEDLSNVPEPPPRRVRNQLTIRVTREKVLRQLKALRADKSPGPDGIHPRVLRELAEVLATPLQILFTTSITSGEVPSQWREATVVPIFKKGNKADPSNYRPVSLTSVLCKTLERIISEEMIAHLRHNSLECPQQHGFTSGKSTSTNLLEALDVWTEALSHNLPVDVIFLDYAKAFDTVPHERLLAQIRSTGCTEGILAWFRGFLTGRRQRVLVGGDLSSWTRVTSGVPQGSVVGPLLFSIFVCDIPSLLESHISMFADDTKIYQAITDAQEAHQSDLQEDLNRLQAWAEAMQMKFHPNKCKVLHLGTRNPNHLYTMAGDDGTLHTLEAVSEEKDLGVTVDHKLVFDRHVQNQVNKANKILGAVRHTFKAIDQESFHHLYTGLVRPHLEYASVTWSPRWKKEKDALEQVQRRATRLVQGISHLPYQERLARLQLPTLEFRRRRADLIQLYKILHGLDEVRYDRACHTCGGSMFQRTRDRRTRGHSWKLQEQHQLGQRKFFFPARVTAAWNKLKEETVAAPSVNSFKSRLLKEDRLQATKFVYEFSYG